MAEQSARSRAAQKKEIIAASNIDTSKPTRFVGFEQLKADASVLDVVNLKDKVAVTLETSPFYAEMGGQVGDTGELQAGGRLWRVVNTQKTANTFLHVLGEPDAPEPGARVELRVDAGRRAGIQRHHTVTHLLHWALHEVVSPDATQKGSYVGPDKLTFDFSSQSLTPAQLADVERLVNERIVENAGVSWTEVPYSEVKGRKDVMQFFGEKYGDRVRVVQIGGAANGLNGYSMELCGGTHTRATGEIGAFRIVSEAAVAAGVRRIEALAGLRAYEKTREDAALISTVAHKINSPLGELERKLESLLAEQKELEKRLKAMQQSKAADTARGLAAKAQNIGATPVIIENLGAVDADFLQSAADALKGSFKGVIVLGGASNGAVSLVAAVSPDFTAKVQAGKIIQTIAPIVGGKGGGRPDNARGGGKDVAKLDESLRKARDLLGG
jgi:alanyl-tRNA synthetase